MSKSQSKNPQVSQLAQISSSRATVTCLLNKEILKPDIDSNATYQTYSSNAISSDNKRTDNCHHEQVIVSRQKEIRLNGIVSTNTCNINSNISSILMSSGESITENNSKTDAVFEKGNIGKKTIPSYATITPPLHLPIYERNQCITSASILEPSFNIHWQDTQDQSGREIIDLNHSSPTSSTKGNTENTANMVHNRHLIINVKDEDMVTKKLLSGSIDVNDNEYYAYESFGTGTPESSTRSLLLPLENSRKMVAATSVIANAEPKQPRGYNCNGGVQSFPLPALKVDNTFAAQSPPPLFHGHRSKPLKQLQQLLTSTRPSASPSNTHTSVPNNGTIPANPSNDTTPAKRSIIFTTNSNNVGSTNGKSWVGTKSKNSSNKNKTHSTASSGITSPSSSTENNTVELNNNSRITNDDTIMSMSGIRFVSHESSSNEIPVSTIPPSNRDGFCNYRRSDSSSRVASQTLISTDPQTNQFKSIHQLSPVKSTLVATSPRGIMDVFTNDSASSLNNNVYILNNSLQDRSSNSKKHSEYINKTMNTEERHQSFNHNNDNLLRLSNSSKSDSDDNPSIKITITNDFTSSMTTMTMAENMPNLMDDCTVTTADTCQTDVFSVRREKEEIKQNGQDERKRQYDECHKYHHNNAIFMDIQEGLGAVPRPATTRSMYDALLLMEEEEDTITTGSSDVFDDLNTTTTTATSDAFDGLTKDNNNYRNSQHVSQLHSKVSLFSLEHVAETEENETKFEDAQTNTVALLPLPVPPPSKYNLSWQVEALQTKIKESITKSNTREGDSKDGNEQQKYQQIQPKEAVYTSRPTPEQLDRHQQQLKRYHEKHDRQQHHQQDQDHKDGVKNKSTNFSNMEAAAQKETEAITNSITTTKLEHPLHIEENHMKPTIKRRIDHRSQKYRWSNTSSISGRKQFDVKHGSKKIYNRRHDIIAQVTLSQTYSTDKEPLSDTDDYSTSSTPSCCTSNTSSSSYAENDLFQYYIQPEVSRKLIETYRKFSQAEETKHRPSNENYQDAKKAFALFEMRSRIMETDIERGLERRGGTTPVDDIVLTQYHLKGLRIRDAIIVSKAWRDGAAPKDVITAALLMQTCGASTSGSENKGYTSPGGTCNIWYEEHARIHQGSLDDTDILQLKCPSLGPRSMRGFDMFTIGDCQSLLLKLTNERVAQLTIGIKYANERKMMAGTAIVMNGGDIGSCSHLQEIATQQAKMEYSSAVEEGKTLTMKLKLAQRGFQLVHSQIKSVIAKYEKLLMGRVEYDSDSDSNERDDQSESNSYGSTASWKSTDDDAHYDYDLAEQHGICKNERQHYHCSHEMRSPVNKNNGLDRATCVKQAYDVERNKKCSHWKATQAKEETNRVKEEIHCEIKALQERVVQLEIKSSMEREEAAIMVEEYERQLEEERQSATTPLLPPRNQSNSRDSVSNDSKNGSTFDAKSLLLASTRTPKDERKIRSLKHKFRSRHAEKTKQCSINQSARSDSKQGNDSSTNRHHCRPSHTGSNVTHGENSGRNCGVGGDGVMLFARSSNNTPNRKHLSGMEMYQHLDFYKRSLRSLTAMRNE